MKKIIAVSCLALGLVACGVDREGTRDEFIKQLEAAGMSGDADCIDGVLDKYSDDELTQMDKDAGDNNITDELQGLYDQLASCIASGS